MKSGLTIESLATEIFRLKEVKEDYMVNTQYLQMDAIGDDVVFRVLDENKDDQIEPLDVGEIAHRQIGTHLSIPAKYYAKMLAEKPELLCVNVNSWMEDAPSKRWFGGSEYDENTAPLCSSMDGKQGIGTPGGTCAACPFNQKGSL